MPDKVSDNRKIREAGIGANLPAGFIEKHGLIDPSTVEDDEADETEPASSLSGERERFEAEHPALDLQSAYSFAGNLDRTYEHNTTENRWLGWQAARSHSQPDAAKLGDFIARVGKELGRRTNMVDSTLIEIRRIMEAELALEQLISAILAKYGIRNEELRKALTDQVRRWAANHRI